MTAGGDGARDSIPAMAAATADRFGQRLAIADGDVHLTYAELVAEARTFGAALVASGVEAGDRVAIWAPNGAEWVVAALGLFQAGAVLVPVNTRFKGPEAADILSRSRARVLVTVTDFLGADYLTMLEAAGAELADLRTIVVARGPARPGTEPWDGFLARATDATRAEADRRATALGADDPSDILFTSGTTGVPKGVVQTHGRTVRVATDWVAMTGLGAGDRYLMVNPYFHMFGLKAGILASVAAGATMLPEPVFDVDRVLARVAEEAVTVLPGPPTLYQSILDHPARERHDLSSLRVAVTGAADIPVKLIRRIDQELPFSTIITGYGLTEAGTATATSPGDDVETIATTVGRPRPGFELRIVGDGGRDVPAGEPGEILLRGASVMARYLDDPEATAEALTDDGWLRTGDLGVLDDGGCLRIVGRAKDMFIVGGFNAYPAEIENTLLRHPDIQQAAVIGVPDERLGEVGMAFVVTRPGSATTGPDIIRWSRDQMANYKVPRTVEIVGELPLNATGKVMKDALRERATDAIEGGTMTDFDHVDFFRGDELIADPHPYFDDLRRRCPVHPEPHHGVMMVTGYAEAVAIFTDPETFSSCNSVTGPFPGLPVPLEGDDVSDVIEQYRDDLPFSDQLPTMDPPKHKAHRGLLMRLLTPKRLRENEDFMWRRADGQIDQLVAGGECELVGDFAGPFTLYVIADLLGVPEADHETFREELQGGHDPNRALGSAKRPLGHTPLEFLYDRFAVYVEDRRRRPRDDVLTSLALATFPDGSTPEVIDVVRVATNLFSAGQETTVRLLAGAFQVIAERPDLQRRLRDDPDRIPDFVEECLRIESPVKGDFRLARRPASVGGVDIPAGTTVMVVNGAANRDPRRFADPAEFDLDRANAREHLAFGRGIHACPGGPLARAEARVAIARLLERTGGITISEAAHGPAGARRFEYAPTYILRGLRRLHLELTPAG